MNNKTEEAQYRVERLDQDKLKDLEALYTAVYGKLPPKDHFIKKYNTSYTGLQYIGYIAYNAENIPLAYYGVLPCFIQYNDQIILSAQSGDTMTHPLFRYKGMFVELSRITFELCRVSGIRIVFGFPNQNSYHGAVQKLGWKMTETLACFTIPVRALPLESICQRFQFLNHAYKKYISWNLRPYALEQKGLPNSVACGGYGGVYRDARYQQYKTYSPAQVLSFGSTRVWLKIKSGMILGDLEIKGPEFDQGINTLVRLARRLGLLRIVFQVSPGTPIYNLFATRFRPLPSFPVLFQDFGSGIPLDKLKFSFGDIDIF
jgi:hypothetical protein